eukprot:UN32387
MDAWQDEQLEQMKKGGNGVLLDFWAKQKIDPKWPALKKYDNVAMEKYRERLKKMSKGQNAPTIPFIGYKPVQRKKRRTWLEIALAVIIITQIELIWEGWEIQTITEIKLSKRRIFSPILCRVFHQPQPL